jgi:hypothetical protein
VCRRVDPALRSVGTGHRTACHLYDEAPAEAARG